jgi:hypothetical protein
VSIKVSRSVAVRFLTSVSRLPRSRTSISSDYQSTRITWSTPIHGAIPIPVRTFTMRPRRSHWSATARMQRQGKSVRSLVFVVALPARSTTTTTTTNHNGLTKICIRTIENNCLSLDEQLTRLLDQSLSKRSIEIFIRFCGVARRTRAAQVKSEQDCLISVLDEGARARKRERGEGAREGERRDLQWPSKFLASSK